MNRAPLWTADEKLSGRCVNNEVQFFSGDDFCKLSILKLIVFYMNVYDLKSRLKKYFYSFKVVILHLHIANPTTKLYLPNVSGFTFSPSPSTPYMVAAHVVGKKVIFSIIAIIITKWIVVVVI